MGKNGWQAVAFVAIAVAAMASAAAWHSSRSLDVATAQLREREQAAPNYEPDAMPVRNSLGRVQAVQRSPGDRCINGTSFRKVGNEWQQLGPC